MSILNKNGDVTLNQQNPVAQGTLGTFAGVFTPSILTILGIILFLRLGYVVGNAGLGRTLLILFIANAISVLTTISLSAVATNLKVKGGGDYYLISRTLGLEFGGALGVVLFLAQAISIGFYCIGFAEVVSGLMNPVFSISPRILAVSAMLLLFTLAWQGADWATKFQYVVMTILALALCSFFIGGLLKWDPAILAKNWLAPTEAPNFWILFAIFFPAVTGFTQGVSMSGDLKDPGKSLPHGTFLAVGISILIYVAAAVLFCGALPQTVMQNDYGAMGRVSVFPALITAGVIAATLSSAMASFLGAPRILQSLSKDRIFPFLLPFAKGTGPDENPRRGVLMATGIALITVAIGDLNYIAPIVSMFFLISYGLLNFATYFEARSQSPYFRPRFRWYSKRASLFGALACFGVMLAIDFSAGLIAIAIITAIYQYLQRTSAPARWADGRRSFHIQSVRENLLAAAREPEHPRDWRPQLLVFSDDEDRRAPLLRLVDWLTGDSGLITVARVVEAEGVKAIKMKKEAEAALETNLKSLEIEAFPLVVAAPSFDHGVEAMVQSVGIGPLKVNTIVFNWFKQESRNIPHIRQALYGSRLRSAFRFGCNIVVVHQSGKAFKNRSLLPDNKPRIDIWWQPDATGRLMLLLAHLMTRSQDWEDSTIRIMDDRCDTADSERGTDLESLLQDVRIEATCHYVDGVDIAGVSETSSDAGIIFIPLKLHKGQPGIPFGDDPDPLLARLDRVVLVLAAEDIDLDAQPEDGLPGEMATAMDALDAAEKKAHHAEKDAKKAVRIMEKKQEKLETAEEQIPEDKEIEKIEKEARFAEEAAQKAVRRSVKAAAKVQNAQAEAEALGGLPEKPIDEE